MSGPSARSQIPRLGARKGMFSHHLLSGWLSLGYSEVHSGMDPLEVPMNRASERFLSPLHEPRHVPWQRDRSLRPWQRGIWHIERSPRTVLSRRYPWLATNRPCPAREALWSMKCPLELLVGRRDHVRPRR